MLNRIRHMVGIGRVTLVNDAKEVQQVQVDQGAIEGGARRILDNIPFVGRFGFSSSPPLKSEIVMVRLAGSRGMTVAIGSNHQQSRPRDLKAGDTMVYDIRGRHVLLSEDGVEIDAKNGDVTIINAGTVTVKASEKVRVEASTLEVTGDVVSRADGTRVSLNALRDAYHAHKHTGVQTGGGSTGVTDHDA